MALQLKHQTVDQFIARFREAYRNSEGDRTVALARCVLARIQDGTLTETKLRAAFGLTSAQWNALKTRMQSLVTAYNTQRTAAGE